MDERCPATPLLPRAALLGDLWLLVCHIEGRNGSDKSYHQLGRLGHLPVTLAWGGFEQRGFSTAEFLQLLPTHHELPDIQAKNQEG
jgi:hypothetical protein